MSATHPDRRRRRAADHAAALQSRSRRLRGRRRRARRRGRYPAASETAPDLVVLDWMLPGLSGIELCRRLRARPQTRNAADHHADRARRGERARARARHRRRRLHRQAVLGAGAAGAGARAAAPRQPRARRHGADHRRHRARPREEARVARSAARSISARPNSACWNS